MKTAFMVKVSAGASRNETKGWIGKSLKARIKAPPEKGKGNKELRRFLAKTLGIATSQVTIVSGETSRDKRVSVEGMQSTETYRKLGKKSAGRE
tara:strand:- start:704 stop:985 length:282 start_codon:yes stop_codon:yes gene_type:complete